MLTFTANTKFIGVWCFVGGFLDHEVCAAILKIGSENTVHRRVVHRTEYKKTLAEETTHTTDLFSFGKIITDAGTVSEDTVLAYSAVISLFLHIMYDC